MTLLSCVYAKTRNVLKVQSCDEIVFNFFFKTELLLHLSMFIIADCGCIFYFNMLLVLLSCRFKICWVIVHNILIKVKLAKVLLCLELLWQLWLKNWDLRWQFDHQKILYNMESRIFAEQFLWPLVYSVYQIQR